MKRKHTTLGVLSAATIVAFPMAAAIGQDTWRDQTQQQRQQQQRQVTMFASIDDLKGTDIVNSRDETLGSIDDLVVDRSTGEIRSVIIRSGAVLGIGGRRIALPYDNIQWVGEDREPLIDITEDQLERYPTFRSRTVRGDAEEDRTLLDNIWGTLTGERDRDRRMDERRQETPRGERETVSGTITRVDRVRTGDQIDLVIAVKTENRDEMRIKLGPAAQILGSKSAPMRDAKFSGEVIKVRGARDRSDPQQDRRAQPGQRDARGHQHQEIDAIAVSAKINGETLYLPDREDGMRSPGERDDRDRDRVRAHRLAFASDINGADVWCRGEDCGSVDDVIIERMSGKIAFLSIDMEDGFLGIGSTNRLVPWEIASFGVDYYVRLDANEQMLRSARETPDEITELDREANRRAIYSTFKIQEAEFHPRDPRDRDREQTRRSPGQPR